MVDGLRWIFFLQSADFKIEVIVDVSSHRTEVFVEEISHVLEGGFLDDLSSVFPVGNLVAELDPKGLDLGEGFFDVGRLRVENLVEFFKESFW